MKLRSTTPASKGLTTKSILVAAAVMMAISVPISMAPNTFARDYSAEIDAVQDQINQFRSKANKLNKQAKTLENQLAKLSAERSIIQSGIDLSQKKSGKLKQQIKENEIKIVNNKDALGATLANMYVDDTISPLEMLASSNNIGDYVDKQSYRSSINDQLQETITTINQLKKKLEVQKKDVERLLADQKGQKKQLVAKEVERQQILTETKGKEGTYQKLVKENQAKMDKIKQDQADSFRSYGSQTSGVNAGDPNKGGYPADLANAPQDSKIDPWGMYNRECVSYTAWKVHQKTGGKMPHWGGIGMAWQWGFSGYTYPSTSYLMGQKASHNTGIWHTSNASAYNIPHGSSPQPKSVAVKDANPGAGDPFGHVAWVEKVSDDKTQVYISQYNWFGAGGSGWGNYSEMWVDSSFFQQYLYF